MFDLETQIRKDPLISHKSGFKEVDDLLLTELRVEFLNEDNTWYPVRRWKFIYDQNLSNHLIKTLLISIKEYNGSNELFYEHSMEYYKGQQIFLPEPKIIAFPKDIFNYNPDSSGNPVHQAFKTHMLYFKKKSPLKFSNTKGWSIGSSAGAGLNNSINDKSFTLDFGMSYGELKNVDRAMLTDMSGDGIPDFVIDKGFGIYAYEFDVEKEKINVRSIKKIHNLSRLGNVKTTSYDFNLGFRTADNMISIGNIKIPLETFKATGNLNMTTTRTTEYFTDYNLDGIPDFVVRNGKNLGQVYFGYYDRSGNLHFDKNSLNTHNYVIKGSQNFQLPEEQEIEKDIEIVKSWIAPFDGRIQIQGTAQIADNLTGECLIAIQHNNSFVLMPTVVNSSISHHVNEELYVRKGDYLLFRTNAGNSGHQDLLLWNPIIKYEEDVPRDANGLNYANCSYNEGFLLSGGEALFIDSSTTLRIISDEWIDSTITDTVLLRIIIEKYDENSVFISEESYEKVIIPGVSSASATFKHTATGQQAPFIGQFFNFSLPQIHHLYMKFEVNALSNVDWRKIEWRPKVIYEDVCIGEMTVFYPTVAIKTYNRVERISRPLTLDETNITLGDQVNFMPILTSNTDYSMLLPNQYHRAYFVVKSNEYPALYLMIEAKMGTHTFKIVDSRKNLVSGVNPFSHYINTIGFGEEFYIEIFSEDVYMAEFIKKNLQTIQIKKQNSQLKFNTSYYSHYYREIHPIQDYMLHWGQFGWSNNQQAMVIIPVEEIKIEDVTQGEHYNNFMNLENASHTDISNYLQSNFDELSVFGKRFFMLTPRRGEYHNGVRKYIRDRLVHEKLLDRWSFFNTHMASYRHMGHTAPGILIEEEEEEYLDQSGQTNTTYELFTAIAPVQVQKSSSLALSISQFLNFTQSFTINDKNKFYTRSLSAFRDINGDGFPDVLISPKGSSSEAVMTNTSGGYDKKVTLPFTYIDKIQNKQLSLILSGGFINKPKEFQPGNLNIQYTNTELLVNRLIELRDINGDGMPERYNAEPLDNEVMINKGTGFGHTFTYQGDKKVMMYDYGDVKADDRFSFSASVSPKLKNDMSFSAGFGINYHISGDKSFFMDINGDGMLDLISYVPTPPSGQLTYQIRLNKGMGLYSSPISISNINLSSKLKKYSVNASSALTIPFKLSFLKVTLTPNSSVTYGVDELTQTLMDFNADGLPDLVEFDGENLRIYFNQVGLFNKLKRVTNPLGGSFEIFYEQKGARSGAYPAVVRTSFSPAEEMVIWDMPETKWVMSKIHVYDGLSIQLNNLQNGENLSRVFFHYDGGIKSRQDRKFLGFTRIEKRYLPNKFDIDIFDKNDLNNIEKASNIFSSKSSNINNTNDTAYALDTYLSEVTQFYYPKSIESTELYKTYYLLGQILEKHLQYSQIQFTIIRSSPEGITNIVRILTRKPVVIQSNSYEFRRIKIDKGAATGKVEKLANNTWVKEDFTDRYEQKCIFPALVEMNIYNFPQVESADSNRFYSSQYTIEYDEYFNVVRYTHGGVQSLASVDTLRDTILYIRYDLVKQTNCEQDILGDTITYVFLDSLSSASVAAYLVKSKEMGYEPDIVFLSNNSLSCVPYCNGDRCCEFITYHQRTVLDTAFIIRLKNTSQYNGPIIALMSYFTPSNAAGQSNILKSHEVFVNTTQPQNRKRYAEVISLNSAQLAPENIRVYTNQANQNAEIQISYDVYGNVTKITGPYNHQQQRLEVNYHYDSYLKKYVIEISNSYGDTVCMKYNLSTGNLLRKTDANRHAIEYIYDRFHRLKAVYAPREMGQIAPEPTMLFEYQLPDISIPLSSSNIARVITYQNMKRHEMPSDIHPSSRVCEVQMTQPDTSSITGFKRTITFVDGLGRVVQTKTEVADSSAPDGKRFLVSGITSYDHHGREVLTRRAAPQTYGPPLGLHLVKTETMDSTVYDYQSRPVQLYKLYEIIPIKKLQLTTIQYDWEHLGDTYVKYTEVKQYIGSTLVDPMAHVAPSWSPYRAFYCNPIRYIDPTGMLEHDYGLDKQGNITLLRKTDDPTDKLIALDNDGNETDKSIEVDKGILSSKKTNTVTVSNGKDYTFDQYKIKGDDKAKGLFEFVADNTEVEWSLTGVGAKSGTDGQNILTTSHIKDSEIGGGYLKAYGYTIRKHSHSHPYNTFPSTADKEFAESLNLKFPKATLDIYHKGEYFQYDKNGLISVPTKVPKN
ncbi:JAB-like toxin 1 domain-containing protein [Schleiferia thermophila]|uniref:JAB-like toxin 1 domain-containing protein n=1 Tax=Schleiferia thermophila TaxID=884107 RepID=UPI003EEB3D55